MYISVYKHKILTHIYTQSSNGRSLFTENRVCFNCHVQHETENNNSKSNSQDQNNSSSTMTTYNSDKAINNANMKDSKYTNGDTAVQYNSKERALQATIQKLELQVEMLESFHNTSQPNYVLALVAIIMPYIVHTCAIVCILVCVYASLFHRQLNENESRSLYLWRVCVPLLAISFYLCVNAFLNMDYFYIGKRRLHLYGIGIYVYVGYKLTQR